LFVYIYTNKKNKTPKVGKPLEYEFNIGLISVSLPFTKS